MQKFTKENGKSFNAPHTLLCTHTQRASKPKSDVLLKIKSLETDKTQREKQQRNSSRHNTEASSAAHFH